MAEEKEQDIVSKLPVSKKDGGPVFFDYKDDDVLIIRSIEELPKIYATRLKVNVICACNRGRMELDVSGNHFSLNAGQTFLCPSGMLIENVMTTPDYQFSLVCLTDRVVQRLLSTNVDIWNRAMYVRKERVVDTSDTQQKNFAYHFGVLLDGILKKKEMPFYEEMVRTMLQLVLLGFCARQKVFEQTEGVTPMMKSKPSQATVLFKRFMELLKHENLKHQPVYYYAEKLCVSSKYLSHVCKETTGKSANEFIQSAVIEELTCYLRSTNLSAKEISSRMGFSNISFFGKYVKAHLGVSPNEYRKRLYNGKE